MNVKKKIGDEAENKALNYLQQQGLRLLERNYRVASGPTARGAEIDLIMRDGGTLVFVEVRARHGAYKAQAASSVNLAKQRHVIYAARCYLKNKASPPPCRFDVVAIEDGHLQWLKAAFSLN
jgi:putative endonuclease